MAIALVHNSTAHSLLHNRVSQRITHGVTLAFKLKRGSSLGGAGQLEQPNVRTFRMASSCCRFSGHPRCATHHDDAFLIKENWVDGLFSILDIHHGLIVLLLILGVDGGRHCVWGIGIRGVWIAICLVAVESRGMGRTEFASGRKPVN